MWLTQDVAPGSHVTQAVSRNEASQPAQVTLVSQTPQAPQASRTASGETSAEFNPIASAAS